MQGSKFLCVPTYGRSLKHVMRECSILELAVAYWSNEIRENPELRIKLKEIESSRLPVICDLAHPAYHGRLHGGVGGSDSRHVCVGKPRVRVRCGLG